MSSIKHRSGIAYYTALPYNSRVEFIEAKAFTKHVYEYLSEDEYFGLQRFLFQNPGAGKVIPGSGGLRKIRWVMAGKGKRSGVRIIYYFKKSESEIWLLTIYSKSELDNIPKNILRKIAEELKNA